ncbi:MAG: hypothetical protein HRT36_07055 [Alphaproteobacteria bacterium]|nr:hypothetical protein [Alphaproteobacteria bacterium]
MGRSLKLNTMATPFGAREQNKTLYLDHRNRADAPVGDADECDGWARTVVWCGVELLARNPNLDNPAQVLPLNKTLAGIAHKNPAVSLPDTMLVMPALHVI